MKKIFLSLCTVVACLQVFAQSPVTDSAHRGNSMHRRHEGHAPIYINLGTGINNNGGIIALGLEVPVAQHFSVEGGFGISTWGSKLYLCGKYYLQPDFKGWAFGPGITHSTGLQNFTTSLETIYSSSEAVQLDLASQTNVFLAAYRNWRLGRRDNRIFLELGWSVGLNAVSITQTAGNPITDNSARTIRAISPGGLIVAVGFSFGAGSKKRANEEHYRNNHDQ